MAVTLPADWAETTVSDPNGQPERVYRKAAGDLVLTLDARAIDTAPGALSEKLEDEWRWFIATRRRHAGE